MFLHRKRSRASHFAKLDGVRALLWNRGFLVGLCCPAGGDQELLLCCASLATCCFVGIVVRVIAVDDGVGGNFAGVCVLGSWTSSFAGSCSSDSSTLNLSSSSLRVAGEGRFQLLLAVVVSECL